MMNAPRVEPLPVFPLTGTLLLPGAYLPLNIFEPRYRNMVRDALDGDGAVGMIQPQVPGLDNWGIETTDEGEPALYPVGCKGRIAQHQLQEDGRYLIVLEGLSRFRVVRELEPVRGYRLVEADLGEFEIDRTPDPSPVDPTAVLSVLESYARRMDLEVDAGQLEAVPGDRLVSVLSTALPFSPAEKQALLEAYSPEDRAELLTTLMRFELETTAPTPSSSPPPVH